MKLGRLNETYNGCIHPAGVSVAAYVSPLFAWTVGGANLVAWPNLTP